MVYQKSHYFSSIQSIKHLYKHKYFSIKAKGESFFSDDRTSLNHRIFLPFSPAKVSSPAEVSSSALARSTYRLTN
ncbi:hypothetical protein K7X08_035658 [Anisodus acutangulus]|uniref:Uncharacterized protein n=1 Tax=Anisodus acutangulus TaxID=402998 RepID=A0A9Q1R436_9SOLA|nr:hypothetical protein K7X08_035658 [Anisodus acutangulus]